MKIKRVASRGEILVVGGSCLTRISALKTYIPSKLFAGSNLPEVDVRVGDEKKAVREDVSLALSSAGYLPGKPTFRIRSGTGVFVPLDSSFIEPDDVKPIVTRIEYYDKKLYGFYISSCNMNENLELPDEYNYLLNEVLNRKFVEPYPVSEITVFPFRYNNQDRKECARWLFYLKSKKNFEDRYVKGHPFYVYLETSNAFPRFSIFYLIRQESSQEKSLCCRGLIKGNVSAVPCAFYGVYAVDVQAILMGKYLIKGNIHNTLTSRSCAASTKDKRRKYRVSFVKVFVDDKDDSWSPVVLGYEIRNTKMISLNLDNVIDKVLPSIEEIFKVNSPLDLEYEYRILSLNTLLTNVLRHYLSHDLVIVHYMTALGFTKINRYIDLLLLINDLFKEGPVVNMMTDRDKDKFVDDLVDKISYFEEELEEPWVLVLRYILTAAREGKLEKYRVFKKIDQEKEKDHWHKIKNRLKKILEKYETNGYWYLGAILDILFHSYNHHLVRTISSRWSVSPDKFIEYYFETDTNKVNVLEKDSGGIGILKTAFEFWENSKNKTETAKDLVLTLGKCLVGTPEDLLHFALVKDDTRELLFRIKDKDEVSVRKGIKTTLERLNIVVTPEEFEEAVKLWRSIYEEAERLTRMLRGFDPEDLLKEVHELRYELEQKIRRFPELSELIAYAVTKIKYYPTLRKLLVALLRANVPQNSDEYQRVKELYKNDKGDYIENFVKDINNLFEIIVKENKRKNEEKGYTTDTSNKILTLRKINECLKARRGNNDDTCRSIIHLLKLMGRALHGILMRISLLSCNGACGMCYVNTKSCSRFGASFVQARTLDRRVLKIVASELVKKAGRELKPVDYYKQSEGVDPVVEVSGKPFSLGAPDVSR